MPRYQITDEETGAVYTLTFDHEPTEEELQEAAEAALSGGGKEGPGFLRKWAVEKPAAIVGGAIAGSTRVGSWAYGAAAAVERIAAGVDRWMGQDEWAERKLRNAEELDAIAAIGGVQAGEYSRRVSELWPHAKIPKMVGETAGILAPTLLAAPVAGPGAFGIAGLGMGTGGVIGATAGAAGAQSAAGYLHEARAEHMAEYRGKYPNMSDEDLQLMAIGRAAPWAALSGAKTAALTGIGGVVGGRLLGTLGPEAAGVGGRLGGRGAAAAGRQIGGAAALEGVEEGIDEAVQSAIDKWTIQEEMTGRDAVDRVVAAVGMGALFGGAIETATRSEQVGAADVEAARVKQAEDAEAAMWQETAEPILRRSAERAVLRRHNAQQQMQAAGVPVEGESVLEQQLRGRVLEEEIDPFALELKELLARPVPPPVDPAVQAPVAPTPRGERRALERGAKMKLPRAGEELLGRQLRGEPLVEPEPAVAIEEEPVAPTPLKTVDDIFWAQHPTEPPRAPSKKMGEEALSGIVRDPSIGAKYAAPMSTTAVTPPAPPDVESGLEFLRGGPQMGRTVAEYKAHRKKVEGKLLTSAEIGTLKKFQKKLEAWREKRRGRTYADPTVFGQAAVTAGIEAGILAAKAGQSVSAVLDAAVDGAKKAGLKSDVNISELRDVLADRISSEMGVSSGFMDKVMFHVAYTDSIPRIMEEGLQPFQTSNWVEAGTGERYGGGQIFAMDNLWDAAKWASEMDWNKNSDFGTGDISVVAFTGVKGKWEVDEADPMSQAGLRGKWFKRRKFVPPRNVLWTKPYDEAFQKEHRLSVDVSDKTATSPTRKKLVKMRNSLRSYRKKHRGRVSALPADIIAAQLMESALNVALKAMDAGQSIAKALDAAYASLGETSISRKDFDSSMLGRMTSVIELMEDGTSHEDAVAATRAPLDGKVPFEIVESSAWSKGGVPLTLDEGETVEFAGPLEPIETDTPTPVREEEGLPDETVKPDPYKLRWGKHTGSKLWKSIKRFFSYGMSDVAASNTMYGVLGKQMDNQVDIQDKYIAYLRTALLENGPAPFEGASKAEKETAAIEFAEYQRKIFYGKKGDPAPSTEGYSEVGKGVIEGWKKVAEFTGNEMVDARVRVRLPNGKYRDFKMIGEDFWGRMMIPEYAHALNELTSETTELTAELEAFGKILKRAKEIDRISVENIRNWWWKETGKIGKGRRATGDQDGNRAGAEQTAFFSGIDKARTKNEPLGEAMDFTLGAGEQWIYNWSRRMAQVNAYGQKTGGAKGQQDLFDTLLQKLNDNGFDSKSDEVRFVMDARKGAYELTEGTTAEKAVNLSGKVATLTMLTGIFNAIRNTTGWGPTASVFGLSNSFNGMKKLVEYADAAKQSRSWGTLQNNAEMLLAGNDISGGPSKSVDVLVKGTLKYSLFTLAENTVRIHAGFTASSFITEGIGAVKSENNPELAAEFREMAERFDTNPDLIIKEDSPTGEETSKFIRRAVKEVQGGYKFNQLPAYMGTTAGRFMFKFGSYGLQITRAIRRNALAPIAKNPTNLRSWLPLMRFIGTAAGNGELLYALRDLLFGKERPDKTLEEIARGDSPMADAFWRLVNNITYAGTLGIIGDLSGMARSVQTKRRVRNPLEPAGTAIASNTLVWLNNAVREKGLSEGAFKEFMRNQFSLWRYGIPAATKAAGLIAPEWDVARLQKAEGDRNFLRNATRRFQEAVGDDVKNMIGAPTYARSPYTQYYSDVKDELMIGDVKGSRKAALEFAEVLDPEDRDGAWARLSNSISASQPMKIGDARNKEIQMEFISWARRNLSESDVERILKVQRTYMSTAKNAGLISGGNEKVLRSTKVMMNLKKPKGRKRKRSKPSGSPADYLKEQQKRMKEAVGY